MDFSKTELNQIAKKYQLADIYIFGSQVSGFQRKESDFDIGVRFEKSLPKKEKRANIYGNLFSDLNICFKNKKIDLVFLEEVHLHFQFKIISQGELIYSKDREDSLNFKEKIINYYRDYKYFIDEYFQGILEVSTKT